MKKGFRHGSPLVLLLVAALGLPAAAQPDDGLRSGGDAVRDEDAAAARAEALEDRPVGPERTEPEPGSSLRGVYQRRMLELLEEDRYDEAAAAARQVVRLITDEYGENALALGPALQNLALVEMLDGDLPVAETNFKRSIEVIRQNRGRLAPTLVNAYVGLGATYNRAGLYEQAREAFDTALRLSHVNEGFYNDDQFKIRDGLTESYLGLRDYESANFHQETQLEIHKRKLGEDSPDIAPAMYKLARWYERIGQLEAARNTYQSAQRILRRHYGGDDSVLVDALTGIAGTYEQQGLMAESSRALRNALRIIEDQDPPDFARRGEMLVRLGDLYARNARTDTARAYYEDAWQALSVREEDMALRADYFDTPERIQGVSFGTAALGPGVDVDAPELAEGFLEVRYDVSEAGEPERIVVIDANPPGLMDERIENIIARSRYRPRFEAGRPVRSENLSYRHEFRYRPEDTSTLVADKGDAAAPESGAADRGGKLEDPRRSTADE